MDTNFWKERLTTDRTEGKIYPGAFEFVIIRIDSARFDSTAVERLNSRP
jgi:hypothetical protein